MSGVLHAQVVAAGRGGAHVVGGGYFSAYRPDYGPNELLGWGGFLDLNLRGHLGLEGEIRFLRFNQTYDVHKITTSWGHGTAGVSAAGNPMGSSWSATASSTFPFSYGHGGYLMLVGWWRARHSLPSLHDPGGRLRIPALDQFPGQFPVPRMASARDRLPDFLRGIKDDHCRNPVRTAHAGTGTCSSVELCASQQI